MPTFGFSARNAQHSFFPSGANGSTSKEKCSTLLLKCSINDFVCPISWRKRSTLVLDFTTDGPSSHPDCSTFENNRPTTVGIVRHFQRSVHHFKIYVQYGKKFVRHERKITVIPEKTSITAGKMSIIAPGVRHSNGT